MTPEERAEKIITTAQHSGWEVGAVMDFPLLCNLIAAEIREAVREGISDSMENDPRLNEAKQKIRAEAYEDAKKAFALVCYWCSEKTPNNDGHLCPHLQKVRDAALEDAAKIADTVCGICPDEDGDCCPASNHSAASSIRARIGEK